jgi:predicted nucleic acid-binding protein
VHDADLCLSVLVLGELRHGIERKRRSDPVAARNLDRWFASLTKDYGDLVLPIDDRVAEQWGRLNVPDPLPIIEGLIAATALVHGLTVVTRNEDDYARAGVGVLNPFEARSSPRRR